MAIIRSQCGQCGVGCGIRAITGDDRRVIIEGDGMHPANGGLLCGRGHALADMVALDGRLLHPMVEGRRQSWDRTIARIAKGLSATLARHGPGSIALHVGGGLLTEDYYVANKLMKGFFGSAHIHAPWRGGIGEGQRAAFGEDVMPAAYEDVDRADTILMVGAQVAQTNPVLMTRVQAAREEHGARVILLAGPGEGEAIDADLRLTIAGASAARLIAGLLLHVHDSGASDAGYLARHVMVPDDFWDRLRPGHDIWSVARACARPAAEIRAFYECVAASDRLVTLFDDDAPSGLIAAILNLHLATGRIGRPGATPFAVSRTANAMGARETGCVATDLAAHRGFDPQARGRIARLWGAERLAEEPGLEGEGLLRAMVAGKVKALWSIGADLPAGPWLQAARRCVPLTIRSTTRLAEEADGWTMLLPSPSWVEKDGTLTGMDRLVSRQRRLLTLPDEVKPDWWMLTRVAQAMGWGDAFYYERAAEIYREHGRLTAYGNDGARLLNLKRDAPISNPAYDELTPWRWGGVPFDGGHFPTADGKARLVPIAVQAEAAMP
ncbi:MAG: molybdopterin-dependent oxidoreductase [Sphingomonadaceae bacterium]|nr:molybdopterin-dependent oxidoreductase [Sphingomonadaceae bacterium]